ncbi:hypothetical protein VHEMI03036 [[Torrubiella] hemipterigena]|uniref:Cell wall protein PhiA n=1 Tax=[Torrubiella] hemipterigena TaxID=1531966 RepID=A0A0A1SXD7_9HYPO|nr:hypothetical protein VHEMI03036 [[Torrubiella] hemipterigena]
MKFITSTTILASVAAAAPAMVPSAPQQGVPFVIQVLREGSPLQGMAVSAANGNLYLAKIGGDFKQDAVCKGRTTEEAFMYIYNGKLHLVGDADQQVAVQQSSAAPGVINYAKMGGAATPSDSTTGDWAMGSEGQLQFKGEDLVACPSTAKPNAPYVVSTMKPGGLSPCGAGGNCISFKATAGAVSDAPSCVYTQ